MANDPNSTLTFSAFTQKENKLTTNILIADKSFGFSITDSGAPSDEKEVLFSLQEESGSSVYEFLIGNVRVTSFSCARNKETEFSKIKIVRKKQFKHLKLPCHKLQIKCTISSEGEVKDFFSQVFQMIAKEKKTESSQKSQNENQKRPIEENISQSRFVKRSKKNCQSQLYQLSEEIFLSSRMANQQRVQNRTDFFSGYEEPVEYKPNGLWVTDNNNDLNSVWDYYQAHF